MTKRKQEIEGLDMVQGLEEDDYPEVPLEVDLDMSSSSSQCPSITGSSSCENKECSFRRPCTSCKQRRRDNNNVSVRKSRQKSRVEQQEKEHQARDLMAANGLLDTTLRDLEADITLLRRALGEQQPHGVKNMALDLSHLQSYAGLRAFIANQASGRVPVGFKELQESMS
jgi:hypothetical protein